MNFERELGYYKKIEDARAKSLKERLDKVISTSTDSPSGEWYISGTGTYTAYGTPVVLSQSSIQAAIDSLIQAIYNTPLTTTWVSSSGTS